MDFIELHSFGDLDPAWNRIFLRYGDRSRNSAIVLDVECRRIIEIGRIGLYQSPQLDESIPKMQQSRYWHFWRVSLMTWLKSLVLVGFSALFALAIS